MVRGNLVRVMSHRSLKAELPTLPYILCRTALSILCYTDNRSGDKRDRTVAKNGGS
jgi:hypothetical protein